jgi:hypothetical protein
MPPHTTSAPQANHARHASRAVLAQSGASTRRQDGCVACQRITGLDTSAPGATPPVVM